MNHDLYYRLTSLTLISKHVIPEYPDNNQPRHAQRHPSEVAQAIQNKRSELA
jgi:hypothetical protein